MSDISALVPPWVDREALNRLVSSDAPCDLSVFLSAGKLLLGQVGSPADRKAVRRALGQRLGTPTLDVIADGFELCALEMRDAWHGVVAAVDPTSPEDDVGEDTMLEGIHTLLERGTSPPAAHVLSLMLLRHDMEALACALAAGAVACPDSCPDAVEDLRVEMRGTCDALDADVLPFVDRLRWSLAGTVAPPELADCIGVVPGAWWLDLADPLFSVQAREEQVVLPARATAATIKPGLVAEWEFEQRIMVVVSRDAASQLWANVRNPPRGEGPLDLVWQAPTQDGGSSRLDETVEGVCRCKLPTEALDADVVALRRGKFLWVRLS